MPRPVYILCSQSGSVDQETGLSSIFNLIEEIKIVKITDANKGVFKLFSVRIVALWMKTDDDKPEQVFETEFVARIPHHSQELETVFARAEFSFIKPFHRLGISQLPMLHAYGPGILWIECRVRRKGESEWLARQDYPIILAVGEDPTAIANPAPTPEKQ